MKAAVRVLVPLVALIVVSSGQRREFDAIYFPGSDTTFLHPLLNTPVNYSPQVPLKVQPLQPRTNSTQQVPHAQIQHPQSLSAQNQFLQGQNLHSQNLQGQLSAGPNPQRAPPNQRPLQEKYTIPENKNDASSQIIPFAWKLFKGSKPSEQASNLVLSPVILQFLLAILEKAADGETKAQLRDVLGSQSARNLQPLFKPTSRNVQLESASGIFIEASDRIDGNFAKYAKSLGTEILHLDFRNYPEETKQQINRWASDATHGTITELISPGYDVRQLSIVLVTAIYFHSNWLYRFTETQKGLFYPNAGGSASSQGVPTDFMIVKQNLVVDSVNLGHGIGGKVIEIPYDDENYSMLVIVPADNVTLDQFIGQLTVPVFESIIKLSPHKLPRLVTLKMPKFKISSRFSVLNSLLKMGVVDLFDINSNLQHLGLRGTNKVSDIIQEARLIVDENGTVASAATGSFLIPLSAAPKQDYIFSVHKPFLAVIIDKKNDVPLFISEVYKPAAYKYVLVRARHRDVTRHQCSGPVRSAQFAQRKRVPGVFLLLTTGCANLGAPYVLRFNESENASG